MLMPVWMHARVAGALDFVGASCGSATWSAAQAWSPSAWQLESVQRFGNVECCARPFQLRFSELHLVHRPFLLRTSEVQLGPRTFLLRTPEMQLVEWPFLLRISEARCVEWPFLVRISELRLAELHLVHRRRARVVCQQLVERSAGAALVAMYGCRNPTCGGASPKQVWVA